MSSLTLELSIAFILRSRTRNNIQQKNFSMNVKIVNEKENVVAGFSVTTENICEVADEYSLKPSKRLSFHFCSMQKVEKKKKKKESLRRIMA